MTVLIINERSPFYIIIITIIIILTLITNTESIFFTKAQLPVIFSKLLFIYHMLYS